MNHRQISRALLWTLFILFLFVGCSAPATPAPIQPTETSSPTTESVPEIVAEFEITFDGKDCTATGPTEVPAGKHTFSFIDISDMSGELVLVNLDEGKTIQDLLDGQSEPSEWYEKPPWAHYDANYTYKSQESNGKRVSIETWLLDKVGEHTILCYVGSGRQPQMLWVVAPIFVVEAPSE